MMAASHITRWTMGEWHHKLYNPIFGPVRILSVPAPLKESAMASIRRCDQRDMTVPLYRQSREHGIGNQGIVLRRNNQSGNLDTFNDVACACAIIIIGRAMISTVGRRVPVVEIADSHDVR